MNVNDYLAKDYGPQGCWSLVADVYQTERQAIAVDFRTINRSIREMAGAFSLALHKSPHGFVQVAAPVDLCIVLLGKTEAIGVHHCGIYFEGRVLHALTSGNYYEELSVIQDRFALVEFWAKPA